MENRCIGRCFDVWGQHATHIQPSHLGALCPQASSCIYVVSHSKRSNIYPMAISYEVNILCFHLYWQSQVCRNPICNLPVKCFISGCDSTVHFWIVRNCCKSVRACPLETIGHNVHLMCNARNISVDSYNVQLTFIIIHVVCRVNEYVDPATGVCISCPVNSVSAGGIPTMCTCNAGSGRVDDSDVTLPCFGELRSMHLKKWINLFLNCAFSQYINIIASSSNCTIYVT